jgi:hypothetical protein
MKVFEVCVAHVALTLLLVHASSSVSTCWQFAVHVTAGNGRA